MKYFLDTEFHEYKKNGVDTIELISIGIVCEDGRVFYAESLDFDLAAAQANEWLNEHVISRLWSRQADKSPFNRWSRDGGKGGLDHNRNIAIDICTFVEKDKEPQFYGYYADYDWVVFCWLFGRMVDLPKGFPMYCRDLKQTLDAFAERTSRTLDEVKALPNYPQQEDEHNALDDAYWNKALYEFLH